MLSLYLKWVSWEFPGSPVVRTRHFHCKGPGSIPDWETKIPQAAQCGKKKKAGVGRRSCRHSRSKGIEEDTMVTLIKRKLE